TVDAWLAVSRAEQAQEAVVHGVDGVLGGHSAGLYLLLGGAPDGQAGTQQPAGGQGSVQVAAFLAAPDELKQPAEDRSVPGGILFLADRGQMPDKWVARSHLPPRVEQPDQRCGGR